MDDIVSMTIIKCTSYLASELASNTLPQATVTDDIVKHLTTVYILEYHVVMMLMDDHLTHATNVWVMEKHGECCLAESTYLFGSILRGLLRDCFRAGI
jgi:hypothetical protein